jgi:spore coat protein U-like protein
MTRWLAAWCVLLPLAALAQRARPPSPCPAKPAECQVTTPVFNFGRHAVATPVPIYGEATVTVTCTRASGPAFSVNIDYDVLGLPSTIGRHMRDRASGTLVYDMYVDAGRQQYWGDGEAGTKTLRGKLEVNETTRVVTQTQQVYGLVHGQQVVDAGPWLGVVAVRLVYEIRRCR